MSVIFGLPVTGSDVQLVITRVHLHPLSALVEFWGNFNINRSEDYQTLSKAIQSPGKYLCAGEGNAGDQCLVQINGTWYRSRIVLRRGYNYKVFLIDSGLTFCTTCHVLAWGKKEFFRMPPQVECCVLANVLPVSPDNKWSPVAVEFVKSFQGQHVDAHVQEVLSSHRTWLLHIPFISKQMYEMGFAKKLTPNMFQQFVMIALRSPSDGEGSSEQIANPENERLHKQELYMHPEIVAGTVETVVVTEVRSPQRIFCQLKVFSQEVKNISDQMDQCYGGRSANCVVNPEMIGFPCAAKTNDGMWYRSVLQQVFATDKIVEVLNVDYGTKCLVKMENIRPLSAMFFRMPVVTYICSLHGVIDNGVGWTASQLDYLKSLILHKTVVAKFEYQSVSEGVYYVTLYGDENINNLFSARGSIFLEGEKTQVGYALNATTQKHGFNDVDKFGQGNKGSTWPADEFRVNSSHLTLVQHVSSPSESVTLLNPVVQPAVDHWSEQVKGKFHSFVESAQSNVPLKCPVYAVKDKDSDDYNGVDREAPFPSGLVKDAKPSLQLDSYIYSTHNIKMGTEEGVTVVCVKSVSQFYCQFERNSGVMEDLKLKVNALCHQLETAKNHAPLGPICFAKYCDGHWYRGQIVTTQPSTVVHFVDYGDTIKVDKSDLLAVPKEASDIMMVPVQAVLCSLADVPEDVPKEVNDWFETSSTDCKFKAQVVAKESDGKLLVELYYKSVQINAKIKEMFKIGLQAEDILNREQWVSAKWVTRTQASAPNQQQVRSDSRRTHPSPRANGTSERRCESKLQTAPTQSINEGKKSVQGRKVELYRPPHQRQGNGKPRSLLNESQHRGSFILSKEQRSPEDRNWRESSSTQSEQKPAVDRCSKTEALPKIGDLPTRRIIPGTNLDVYVSHYNSPLSLTVQLVEEEEKIFALVDKLNDPSSSPECNITHVEPGDLVQAEFEGDSSWYRAVVLEVDSKGAILVEFVDFGNTAKVPMSRMARLPRALLEYPVYSTHCMLSEAAGLKNPGLDAQVLSSFKDTVEAIGEKQIRCKFVKQLGSVWEVSLEGIVVNVESKTSAASLDDDVVVAQDEKLAKGDSELDICVRRYLQPDVQEGSQLVVYITNTNEDQTFWCHSADTKVLDSITSRVSEVGESANCGPFDISALSSGSPCIALFPEDSFWYRAEVVDIHGEELSVFYVDYGNKATVRVTDLRQIPQDLLDTPSLAFLCVLEGVDSLHGSWQSGAVDELVSLAAHKELQLTVTKLARESHPMLCNVKLECEGVMMNDALKTWWKTCTPQADSEAQPGDSAVVHITSEPLTEILEPLTDERSEEDFHLSRTGEDGGQGRVECEEETGKISGTEPQLDSTREHEVMNMKFMERLSHETVMEKPLTSPTQEPSAVEVRDTQVPCDSSALSEDAEENLMEDSDLKTDDELSDFTTAASCELTLGDAETRLKSPYEEPSPSTSDIIIPAGLHPKTEKRSVKLIPKKGSTSDGNALLARDNGEILESNLVHSECLEPSSVSPAELLRDNNLIGCSGAPPEVEVETDEPLPEGSGKVGEPTMQSESIVEDVGQHRAGQTVEADDLRPCDTPLVSLLDTQNESVSPDELLPPHKDELSELMSKAEDLPPDEVRQHLLIEKDDLVTEGAILVLHQNKDSEVEVEPSDLALDQVPQDCSCYESDCLMEDKPCRDEAQHSDPTELQHVEGVLQSLQVLQDSALEKDDLMTEDELEVCPQADDSGIPPDDVPQDTSPDKELETEDLISFLQSDELILGDPSQNQTEAGDLPPRTVTESKVVTASEEDDSKLEEEPSASSYDTGRHSNKIDELVCLFHDISLSEMRKGQGVDDERADCVGDELRKPQEDFNDSLLEEASSFADEGVDCELQKLVGVSLREE
ncbi:tudor domain-containing 6 isoform X1 [Synchiropus splendidus]|uniref:tudor domain-containing 6 isoform X1 n=1 Tax=Synchiropus splendidus TaxID=270530 RepID=UPI00237E2E65|nr:tudor domain-containing 6 isoform X1 [Synchiropus splendidus]